VISGAYSMTQQAVQLGLVPHLEVQHTSESQVGQVYMPRVNWMLLAVVFALAFVFGSSSALASAYGIAVTGTMVVTWLLAFTVFRRSWGWPLFVAVAVLAPLLALELIFFGANLAKFLDGGYMPLLLAAVVGVLMVTWVRGTGIVWSKAHASSVALEQLIPMLKKSPPVRAPGTAVFLTADADIAPAALLHNLKHNHVLHDRNVIVTVGVATTPRVPDSERRTIEQLSDSFWRVAVGFGYMEVPNVPRAMALARKEGLVLEMMSTSYFLNRRSFRPSADSGMPLWQDKLFISMTKAASDASSFYRLPSNRVLKPGQQLVV
jgi:KUP system potassium uptake protein